jgi:hypothetical protein
MSFEDSERIKNGSLRFHGRAAHLGSGEKVTDLNVQYTGELYG